MLTTYAIAITICCTGFTPLVVGLALVVEERAAARVAIVVKGGVR